MRAPPLAVLLLVPPALFLGLFFGLPLARILLHALGADVWGWATGSYVRGRLWTAILQALLSVLLVALLAAPLAHLLHRYAIPGRRAHLAIHAAPFVLPVFVVVFGTQRVFGTNGLLHHFIGIDLFSVIGPLGTVVVAHAYYNYGIAARIGVTILDRRSRRHEEAAQVLGASPRGAFWRVSFPAMRHAFTSIGALVFLFTFTSFGVVLYMGAAEVSTLETMVYQNLGGAFPRYDRAAALGLVQLVLNIVILGLYVALRRHEARIERHGAALRAAPRRRHVLTAWAALALGLTPALMVLVGGFRIRGAWTLEAWRALLDHGHPKHLAHFDLAHATTLTLFYAAATVLLAIGLTLLAVYGTARLRAGPRRATEVAGLVPLGTSSILVGLGLLVTYGAHDHFDLRGSFLVIIIAHTLVAFPFAARVLFPAYLLHDRTLDTAAATLGASPWQVFRRVHLPLLRGPLVVAAGFAAAMSIGDFGASLILMRSDNMSLAVWIDRHNEPFDPLMRAQATALAAVLMLLAAAAYLAVERFRVEGRETL